MKNNAVKGIPKTFRVHFPLPRLQEVVAADKANRYRRRLSDCPGVQRLCPLLPVRLADVSVPENDKAFTQVAVRSE